MKLKLILTDSLYFYLANLKQIAILCLPWLMAGAFIEYLVALTPTEPDGQPMFFWAIAFNLGVLPIYTAALVLLMAKQAQNQRPGNRELLMSAVKVWQPFFLLYVLQGAVIGLVAVMALSFTFLVASALLGTQGNSLFSLILVFPVILWVLARLSFAKFYLVMDGLNPIEAVQKSFQTTRPHVRTILSIVFLYILPVMAVMFFSSGLPENQTGYAIGALINTAVSFLLLYIDVLLFRVYMEVAEKNSPEAA